MKKPCLRLVLLAGLAGLLPSFSCSAQPPTPEELKNARVDAITIAAAEQLLKDAKGKVVVVNLWATWCPPCRAELPDLNEF
ncbi:MAG TPA: redoxin family protein, partial [Candidatus Hydrogenedentes bacterium]|nr:redoxin family protein [Candidatus Hydrogenedentota bacterium]